MQRLIGDKASRNLKSRRGEGPRNWRGERTGRAWVGEEGIQLKTKVDI